MIARRITSSLWHLPCLTVAWLALSGCETKPEPEQIIWSRASDETHGVVVREATDAAARQVEHEGYFELVADVWGETRAWALWWDGALLREVQQGAVVRTERCDTREATNARMVLDCVEVNASGGGDFSGPVPVQQATAGQLGTQRIVPLEYLPGDIIRHAAAPDVVYSRAARIPVDLVAQDPSEGTEPTDN